MKLKLENRRGVKIMNKVVTAAGAIVITVGLLTAGPVAAVAQSAPTQATEMVDFQISAMSNFKDIKGHWAESVIDRAIKDGLVKGYQNGSFKPNGLVTRAEFASVMVRATGMEPSSSVSKVFSDVPSGHWAYGAVSQAVDLGFISPSDYGGKFNPNAAMTRNEMAKWLGRGLAMSDDSYLTAMSELKETVLPFTEFYKGGISKAQTPYVGMALGTGVINGFPDGSFGGSKNTTRAEMISMVYRYLNAEGKNAEDFKALNELREVGKYGTNMVSLANAQWGKDYQGNEAPFYNVVGKPLAMKNGMGTAVIDKYILVYSGKTSKDKQEGVYAPMFTSKSSKSGGNIYVGFVKLKVTPSKAITNHTAFNGSIPYVTGQSLLDDVLVNYGLKTVPRSYGGPNDQYKRIEDFFKAGQTKEVWVAVSLDKGSLKSIETTSKVMGTFRLE